MSQTEARELKLVEHVWADPKRMGGVPCFRNTRVPVRTLFAYLRHGRPLAEFLDDFEGVTREQVEAVLDWAEADVLRQPQRP